MPCVPASASITMPRRITSSGHSDNPATAMTNSGSNVWPATAAVADGVASLVGQAGRPEQHSVADAVRKREILTLQQFQAGRRSVPDGRSLPRPSPARVRRRERRRYGQRLLGATTARPCRVSARAGRRWPRHRAARAAICRSRDARRSSLRSRRTECPRGNSSLRNAPSTSSGSESSERARAPSSSGVASSAHWRSSRNSTVGRRRAIAARACRMASKSVARSLVGSRRTKLRQQHGQVRRRADHR